jgi:hypothetical protein
MPSDRSTPAWTAIKSWLGRQLTARTSCKIGTLAAFVLITLYLSHANDDLSVHLGLSNEGGRRATGRQYQVRTGSYTHPYIDSFRSFEPNVLLSILAT